MEVKWNKTAYNQYVGTLEFWIGKTKSESYSKKIAMTVEDIMGEITVANPAFTIQTKDPVYRVQFLKYFSLFFTIKGEQIQILRFWDGRRNPKQLL